jgi:hypothetical protein
MSKNKPGGKRPGKKYRLGSDEIWSKTDARPAKKALKSFLRNAGINIPKHKKGFRSHGNSRNANWL